MPEKSRGQELANAAREMHEAATELRRITDSFSWNRSGMSDEKADAFASEQVHEAREEFFAEWGYMEPADSANTPSPEQVRDRRGQRLNRESDIT